MSDAMPEDHWITKAQAARLAGCPVVTIDLLIERKLLTVRKLPGAYTRVLEREVRLIVEASTELASYRLIHA